MYDTKTLLDNLETRELGLGYSTTTGATSWRHWRNQSTQCARVTRRKGVDLCASFHRTAPPCGQPVTRPAGYAHILVASQGSTSWWKLPQDEHRGESQLCDQAGRCHRPGRARGSPLPLPSWEAHLLFQPVLWLQRGRQDRCKSHNNGREFGFIFQFTRRPTLPAWTNVWGRWRIGALRIPSTSTWSTTTGSSSSACLSRCWHKAATSSPHILPPQVLAERNKEGLEERSWAEALAPRLTKNNRPVQKTLTRGPHGQGEPTFRPDLFFPVYYETKVFPGPALIHCHCCPWPSRQAFSSHIPGRGPLQFSKCCSSGLSVLSVQCNCPTLVHLKLFDGLQLKYF